MNFLFITLALLLVTHVAKADQYASAVQVTCLPDESKVEAQLISYSKDCGDGHCSEIGFEKTDEGKELYKKGITLILPNRKMQTFTCQFGEDVVTVEVEPRLYRICTSESAVVKIKHNDLYALKVRGLYPDCADKSSSNYIAYKLLKSKPDYLSEMTVGGIAENGKSYVANDYAVSKDDLPIKISKNALIAEEKALKSPSN